MRRGRSYPARPFISKAPPAAAPYPTLPVVRTTRKDVINYAQPVNRDAPLNLGLVGWWLNLPMTRGGASYRDLLGRAHGGISDGKTKWSGRKLFGSDTSIYQLGTDSPSKVTCTLPRAYTGDPLTITGWIVSSGDRASLFGLSDRFLLIVDTNTLRFCRTEYDSILSVGGGYIDATITHIGVTLDGTTATYYRDGKVFATAASTDLFSSSTTFYMGGYLGWGYCNGWQNDHRLYNRCLSASEIAALYNASRTGYQLELNRVSTLKRFLPMGPEAAVIVSGNRRRRVLICSGGR